MPTGRQAIASARVTEFRRLLDERDKELNANPDNYYYGGAVPALEHLANGNTVKLFDGGFATKVDSVTSFRADYDGTPVSRSEEDQWGYGSYAEGESFIVKYYNNKDTNAPTEWFFKITGYHDSWDNGKPDVFEATEIVEVEEVPVDKYEWKEVK
jgi:hypothetical protein